MCLIVLNVLSGGAALRIWQCVDTEYGLGGDSQGNERGELS